MATGTFIYGGSVSSAEKSISSTANYYHLNFIGTRMSGVNAEIRESIPKFATINSAVCSIDVKASGSANAYWVTRDTDGNVVSTLWSQSSGISTSYKSFSRDVLSLVESNNADAGLATSIYVLSFRMKSSSSYLGRSYNYKNYNSFTCTFTYPTITVKCNVNNANYGEVVSSTHSLNTPIDIGAKGVWGTQTCVIEAKPKSGCKFVRWSDGNTSSTRSITLSEDALTAHDTVFTYTAEFEQTNCTVTFRNQDGTTVKSYQVDPGSTLGTLPTVSRNGYTFVGWIPCAPAKKTDDTVLDSMQYDGSNFNALHRQYLYSNNLSIHIEAYMSDWMDIGNSKRQIMSCTEGGGWGLGYQANTVGHGFEIHTGSYSGIDLGFGTEGVYADNTWNTFDIVFSNGTVEAYVNGVKKGTITTPNSTISYHGSNTIFVGAEAGANATSPGGNHFKGCISNVFIANQNTRLEIATANTVVNKNVDYYPVWRLNTKINKIYIGTQQPKEIYVGTTPIKAIYVGTTKVYG